MVRLSKRSRVLGTLLDKQVPSILESSKVLTFKNRFLSKPVTAITPTLGFDLTSLNNGIHLHAEIESYY